MTWAGPRRHTVGPTRPTHPPHSPLRKRADPGQLILAKPDFAGKVSAPSRRVRSAPPPKMPLRPFRPLRHLGCLILLFLAIGGASLASEPALVGVGALWRYNPRGLPAPEGWNQAGFDDSAWPEDRSGFGRTTWGETTLLPSTDRGAGTVLFRKT